MLLLLTLVFAITEFGLAFRGWLTVSNAAREGARSGAVFANDASADIETLRSVEEAIGAANSLEVQTVWIYNADTGQGTLYSYTGSGPCPWLPCPDPDSGSYVVPAWNPVSRNVTAPFTDRFGVRVDYDHAWVTGLFGETSDFTADVVFQLEPQVFP